jgi:2-amino-4-hydroxy-6-hydroxymethyldihydropteridine diphosphokinase
MRAYVGLGSNLHAPVRQLQCAVTGLGQIPHTCLRAVSGFYSNPPMGPSQPDYINAVAALSTRLSAHALLGELQTLEYRRGRRRDGARWGPRILDLDLLLMGCLRLESERLTLPHPGVAERAFVLVPLMELAPRLELPDGRTIEALLEKVGQSEVRRLADGAATRRACR